MLIRYSRIARRSRHHARDHAEAFGVQARRCHRLPCCLCLWLGVRQQSPTEAHHEPPRSQGGIDRDTVPLCRLHHALRHDVHGPAIWSHFGLAVDRVLAVVRDGGEILPGDPAEHLPF